jgi:nickel/cobalt transporter (NiCoT) family protein
MTLVDSLDSVLMLYSYTNFSGASFRLFEPISALTVDREEVHSPNDIERPDLTYTGPSAAEAAESSDTKNAVQNKTDTERHDQAIPARTDEETERKIRLKETTMSDLSLILTLISILLAFRCVHLLMVKPKLQGGLIGLSSISLITIMGLIGEQCRQCREAAEAEDGGGLAGKWWRAWAKVRQFEPNHGIIY